MDTVITDGLTAIKTGVENLFASATPIIVGIFLVLAGVAIVFGVSYLAMRLVKRGAGGK
jgi:ABC-type transport system involved in Fe-S cluster assembly fused permease/ATPase subunit